MVKAQSAKYCSICDQTLNGLAEIICVRCKREICVECVAVDSPEDETLCVDCSVEEIDDDDEYDEEGDEEEDDSLDFEDDGDE